MTEPRALSSVLARGKNPAFVLALALAAALAAAPSAHASPLYELLGGITGPGGFNARVVGTGPDATYFNPALLPSSAEAFDLAVLGLGSSLTIDVDPRPTGEDSVDLAPSVYNAFLANEDGGIAPLLDSPKATGDLSPRQGDSGDSGSRAYLALGLVKRVLDDKLVLGFSALLPASEVQSHNVFFVDEREQHFSNSLRFELYDDRMATNTFALALGGRPLPRLAVGIGMVVAIDSTANTPVYVPDGSNLSRVLLAQNLSVDTSLVPHFGLVYEAAPYLRLTATGHGSSSVRISGQNVIDTAGTGTDVQEFSFTHAWEPVSLALGAAYVMAGPAERNDDSTMLLTGSATWRNWSAYEDRQSETPTDRWSDTLTVSAGGRYRTAAAEVMLDAVYVPSPVPDQVGRSNYVDNTRVGVSGGASADWILAGRRLRGRIFVQAHRLLRRSVTKDLAADDPVIDEFPDNAVDPTIDPNTPLLDAQGLQTNNPGFPGFASEGWLLAAGVSAELAL